MKDLRQGVKPLASLTGILVTLLLVATGAQAQTPFPVGYAPGEATFELPETRGQQANRIIRQTMSGVRDDVGGIFKYPFENPKQTGLFVLGVAALIAVDQQTTAFWQDEIEPAFDGVGLSKIYDDGPDWFSAESQLIALGIASSYALGVAFQDERAQTAALLGTKAIAYSYLTTQLVLKPLFGRNRPVDNLSSFSGDPGEFTTD